MNEWLLALGLAFGSLTGFFAILAFISWVALGPDEHERWRFGAVFVVFLISLTVAFYFRVARGAA